MQTENCRYNIVPRNDLGAMPHFYEGAELTAAEVGAWLDTHEDVGTFDIIDARDGMPACGHLWGLAGGACACECGRPECPDTPRPADAVLGLYSLLRLGKPDSKAAATAYRLACNGDLRAAASWCPNSYIGAPIIRDRIVRACLGVQR